MFKNHKKEKIHLQYFIVFIEKKKSSISEPMQVKFVLLKGPL